MAGEQPPRRDLAEGAGQGLCWRTWGYADQGSGLHLEGDGKPHSSLLGKWCGSAVCEDSKS